MNSPIKKRNKWTFEGKNGDDITFTEDWIRIGAFPFGVTKEYSEYSCTCGSTDIYHRAPMANQEDGRKIAEFVDKTTTGIVRRYSDDGDLLDRWLFEGTTVRLMDWSQFPPDADADMLYAISYESCIWAPRQPLFRFAKK